MSRAAGLLKKYSNELSGAISHPDIIASALYAKEVVARGTMSDASVSSKSVLSRSIQLLLDVERVLDSEPSKLQIVLDVLREELTIESLLDEIQREYDELDKTKSSLRKRTTDTKEDKMEQNSTDGEDEESEVDTMSIVMVVLKGVGSVIVLSFFLWLGFMFIYTPPDTPPSSEPTISTPVSSNSGGSPACHPVNPTIAYEELQYEISDSKSLAIHLGISKVKRDTIDTEKQTEKEKLIEVLHACHDLDKCLCWEDIEKALIKYGNVRKARDIRDKYMK